MTFLQHAGLCRTCDLFLVEVGLFLVKQFIIILYQISLALQWFFNNLIRQSSNLHKIG